MGKKMFMRTWGNPVFIMTVKTDNVGVSASNQFTIPTTGSGYLYNIRTSDGQVLIGNTGNTTITFPLAGTYDIKITGSFPRIYFNNTGDRLKLLEIKNFGIYGKNSTSQIYAFYGCANMVITATDAGYFENVTTFVSTWYGCSSLTTFPLIDTSKGINFTNTWVGCNSLTSFPLINTTSATDFSNSWFGCTSLISFPLIDTSSGNIFIGTWLNCASLTAFPLIDMGSGTNFFGTWNGCNLLTSFPLIDMVNGTEFSNAWLNCSSLVTFPSNYFDTNLATNYPFAFSNTALSVQSIDGILVSLDVSGVSNGTFNQSGGNSPSATGITAKNNLISKGWTVTTT